MQEESVVYTIGKELGELASTIQNAFADGKASVGEILEMVKDGGTLTFTSVKQCSELGTAFRDGLDEKELEDLKAGFAEGYDVESASEEMVENSFDAAVTIINGVAKMFIK